MVSTVGSYLLCKCRDSLSTEKNFEVIEVYSYILSCFLLLGVASVLNVSTS